MRFAIVIGVMAATALGCGAKNSENVCGCSDLKCAQKALQSPETIDCGDGPLHGPSDGGMGCAISAVNAGTPFAYRVHGINVDVDLDLLYLLRDDGSAWTVTISRGAIGPRSSIGAWSCASFTVNEEQSPQLSCEGHTDASLPCER